MQKKIIPEKIKLKIGPAATVINRAHKGEPCIVLLLKSLSIFEFNSECLDEESLPSPRNFTNPPRGKAAICHFVPFLSYLDNKTGPNPIEKTSA